MRYAIVKEWRKVCSVDALHRSVRDGEVSGKPPVGVAHPTHRQKGKLRRWDN